ncbi:MAG: chromosome segregation protein SMC [Clostridiales bacterium]|nr:chromosome segregation protein SMC [Clostridiales bacterium]
MYLKSIEVHGFKSFANKMLFEFHDGITGIVGPNGSGKSNVADAVRWVLGEQSAKQLRGAKMEDVIFAGTELRKPMGYAYVAITLDNSDHKLPTSYEEVTVARRVYRSGESEYLMNGTNCRLRDVQELFLDTGIGKEGYSIIGQGQIDKILSGKPEERRELFDEAAGIVKYKKRKAAAQKQLEAEQLNRSRIADILSVMEKQVGPLKEQAETAREYLRLRDELKDEEIAVFFLEHDRMDQSEQELLKKSGIVEEDLLLNRKEQESTKEEYERLERELEEKNRQLEQDRAFIADSRLKKEQYEGQGKVLEEQIHTARQNEEHFQERMASVEKRLADKAKEYQEYEEQKNSFGQDKTSIENTLRNEEEKLNQILTRMSELNHINETGNQQIIDLLNENGSIQAEMKKQEAVMEQITVKKASLNQRILKNKSDEVVYDEIIAKEEERLEKLDQQILGLENVNQDTADKLKRIEKKSVELKQEYDEKQREYAKIQAQLESLKNLTERYDGYGQSIRRVMEQKENNPNIHGVVADLIKVKKDYETAIEIALGGSIQNIVTEDENTAKQMIQFLKKNRYGRATFLPLTTVGTRLKEQNQDILKEPGVIGYADALVDTSSEYKGLAAYLLGRTVVSEHIDQAILLSRKYHGTLRIVTLEGELLMPGGSMSGGAFRNSSNLLGRRREIEDLENKLEEAKKRFVKIKKEQDELISDREKRVLRRMENEKKLHELYIEQNTSRMKLDQTQIDKKLVTDGYAQIHLEGEEIDSRLHEIRAQIRTLEQKEKENTGKSDQIKADMQHASETVKQLKQEERTQRAKVSDASLAFSAMDQRNQFILENQRRVKEEQAAIQAEKESLLAGHENCADEIASKQDAIRHFKEEAVSLDEKIAQAEQRIQAVLQEKEEITRNHKDFMEKREELSNHLIGLEREKNRIETAKERLKEQMDQLMDYMWNEYQLTYSGAGELRKETSLSYQQLKQSISLLKKDMKALGNVNINAIEDYNQMSSEYELMSGQHADLVASEEALNKIILDLETQMRQQFMEKFQDIQMEFNKVFKTLFGGGKGTIELAKDEDVLLAGITITAQPPGKKLQNMMQLSGGEKALTAISLLFAIQNLKPSPFCLLDEIEAALDDSNVTRYAQYLHKLTEHTQFIVITHRRGTMNAADRLYGITMQEKGVSTLVSVNLIEHELEEQEKNEHE